MPWRTPTVARLRRGRLRCPARRRRPRARVRGHAEPFGEVRDRQRVGFSARQIVARDDGAEVLLEVERAEHELGRDARLVGAQGERQRRKCLERLARAGNTVVVTTGCAACSSRNARRSGATRGSSGPMRAARSSSFDARRRPRTRRGSRAAARRSRGPRGAWLAERAMSARESIKVPSRSKIRARIGELMAAVRKTEYWLPGPAMNGRPRLRPWI